MRTDRTDRLVEAALVISTAVVAVFAAATFIAKWLLS